MGQRLSQADEFNTETPPPGVTAPATLNTEAATLPPRPPDAAPETLPAANDSLNRAAIPGYTMLRVLGRGGMGVVYEARQEKLNRLVAVKMILSGSHASSADMARFRDEAEAMARIQHPNIAQVYEIGEEQGLPFLSLEYCSGGSLASQWQGVPQPPEKTALLLETLARAMHVAHRAGVVHRDLKPGNILVTADGQLKITDFGLAKKLDATGLTVTGAVLGTPSYMAPEQADTNGRQVGPPADIYALGAILYEALTGRPPFQAPNPFDTILQVVADEPVPPSRLRPAVPRDLETICLKCLEKEPRRRYATAAELADDLRRFDRGDPIMARPPSVLGRVWRWARLRPALAATLVALAVFYKNHLVLLGVGVEGEGGFFHWCVTGIMAFWVVGAVFFQWSSLRTRWRLASVFGWAGLDVILLTAFLWVGDGPRSALLMGYLLLIAGAALRFWVKLVWFVTGLSLVSYACLVLHARRLRPDVAVPVQVAVIYALGLVIMGGMMSLMLRRMREERSLNEPIR